MTQIHSDAAELPASCKSAAERMLGALQEEDHFADLTEDNLRNLSSLEQQLSDDRGEKIALVAYKI